MLLHPPSSMSRPDKSVPECNNFVRDENKQSGSKGGGADGHRYEEKNRSGSELDFQAGQEKSGTDKEEESMPRTVGNKQQRTVQDLSECLPPKLRGLSQMKMPNYLLESIQNGESLAHEVKELVAPPERRRRRRPYS